MAASGDVDNLKVLLANGADMSLRADEGYTAAHKSLWYAPSSFRNMIESVL